MTTTQLNFERLELKFLIDEATADRVRRAIASVCSPDRHGRAQRRAGSHGYVINSLYLDSHALAFHQAKERGDANRVKLRVRTYAPHSDATLEVKQRRSNVIAKRRAVVNGFDVPLAVKGKQGIEALKCQGKAALAEFSNIAARAGAEPKLSVRYEREAYESLVDQYARVTFDRNIQARPTAGWDLFPDEVGWCRFDDYWRVGLPTHPVVLELKCETTAIPEWMTEVIRSNDLTQTSFSKYSIGTCLTQWQQGRDVRSARSMGALA